MPTVTAATLHGGGNCSSEPRRRPPSCPVHGGAQGGPQPLLFCLREDGATSHGEAGTCSCELHIVGRSTPGYQAPRLPGQAQARGAETRSDATQAPLSEQTRLLSLWKLVRRLRKVLQSLVVRPRSTGGRPANSHARPPDWTGMRLSGRTFRGGLAALKGESNSELGHVARPRAPSPPSLSRPRPRLLPF